MATMLLKVASFMVLGTLAACGSAGGGSPVNQGPVTIVKGGTPAQLYSKLSRQVRNCWLNPRDPVLKKHVFPAGAGAARIEIYEKGKDLKRGPKAFTINFQPQGDGTQIIAQNNNLSYALGQKLTSDVGYWAQGGPDCFNPVVSTRSVARGSVVGPSFSQ